MKKFHYILSILCISALFVSCSQELDIDSNQGYLSLNISSLESTIDPNGTRAAAPSDYNAKTLHVEIRNSNGVVVKSTDNFGNDEVFQGNILLDAGTYTIEAHSAKWDGNGSGFDTPFYHGSTIVQVMPQSLVKAAITCTLANVKLTVNYDDNFSENFKSAVTSITSAVSNVAPLNFVMNQTTKSGYIPVGDFDVLLETTNKAGISNSLSRSFTDVKARDHYIFNFKIAQSGNLGDGTSAGVKVEVDESTNTYKYTFEVPTKSDIALTTRAANAWSNFAILNAAVTAKTDAFKNEGLIIQWKKSGDTDWQEIANDALSIDVSDNVQATLKGLTPNSIYEYRLCYINGDTEVLGEPVSFTTEKQVALYNGGFENWHQSGKPWYPNEEGVKFWDTSNPGSTAISASYNVTTRTDNPKRSGSYAAKLESKKVVIAFAAASMYTGEFIDVNTSTKVATLNWGTPFTTRPTALKGFMQYSPQAIDNVGKNLPASAPGKGAPDQCGIYCALLTESLIVDNADMSKFPDWENDPRVIAYGTLPTEKSGKTPDGQWTEVNIPLIYHDLNKKPTHLLVVFSASKYGDYFHGGKGSTLYLDDFEFIYGDTPSVK